MDISQYKERFKKGENIDFLINKKKMLSIFAIFVGLMAFCVVMFLSPQVVAKIIGALLFICMGYFVLIMGKNLLNKQQPQVLSLTRESLIIYDVPVSALLGGKNTCAIIPWNGVLDLGTETIETRNYSKFSYIVLRCTPDTIQNVKEHEKQVSGKLLRIYEVRNDLLLLNLETWVDVPVKDMLDLIKELHKEATAKSQ